MAIINPWTVMAAGKAAWDGYKWVKKIKKLKKGGGSTVKKIQSGTKPKVQTPTAKWKKDTEGGGIWYTTPKIRRSMSEQQKKLYPEKKR